MRTWPVRVVGVAMALSALTTTVTAQDRLVTLNRFTAPTLVENPVSGVAIGPPSAVVALPPHELPVVHPNLVAMSGARYLFWIARAGGDEAIAVFDRRTQTVGVASGPYSPGPAVQLAPDPFRPRVFVHKWTRFGTEPGSIGVIDATLTYRTLLVADWIHSAFAYAPAANRLVVTRAAAGAPYVDVVILDADTGQQIAAFPTTAPNDRANQLAVSTDGRRVFLYENWSPPVDSSILRTLDGETGAELAASPLLDLWDLYSVNRFVLDEARSILLAPDREPVPPFSYTRRLLALDASSLTPLGTAGGGDYGSVQTFQPLVGKGAVGAYLVWTEATLGAQCRTYVDIFRTNGLLATRVDIAQQTGLPPAVVAYCTGMATLLSSPAPPAANPADVDGNTVTLSWTNPGDTSHFFLDVGLAPGATHFTLPLGFVTTATFAGVARGIYYARLRAVNEIGSSPPSNEISVVVP